MDKKFSLKETIKALKVSDFLLNCKLKLGYAAGIPTLAIVRDTLCLEIPFWKCQITGVKNKNMVYPIRYYVTVTLPDLKPVKFVDLKFDPRFENIDFEKPIGIFPHEAVKTLSKEKYFAQKDELFALYDKMIDMLLNNGPYSEEDDDQIKNLLQMLVEPSLKPFYKAVNYDFYSKYIG